MDALTLSDGLCRQYRRTASNGPKTQMYYPPSTSRPRSHSTGSPVSTPKKTTIKIVMTGKSYTKNRSFEDSKKQSQSCTSRYKTELCRPYQEYRVCKYGDKCQFAHGEEDLRILPRHPKYKTELCRTYHSTGFCPYGPRCHFIHNMDEARLPETPPCSPVKKTASAFTSALPISPSLDSGISSPDGYLGSRSFEFPVVGSQSSSGSGSGSDEGDERSRAPNRMRYTYSPHSDCDLEASESGLQADFSCPDLLVESDVPSSSCDSSPFKPIGEGFNVPSDPALDLQSLLMGLGIKDTPPILPPPPRPISPPIPASIGSGSSLNSTRRLPVFDDMMNSKSDTALLLGYASDPGSRATTAFPTFP